MPLALELVARHRSRVEVNVPVASAYLHSNASIHGTTIASGLSVGS